MQIKITRNTVAAERFVQAGQVIDLPEAEARMLIAIRKAEAVADEPPAPAVLDTVTAEAVVDTDAPKAKRGRRAK